MGRARFCVVCGSPLHGRERADRERELEHVRWALDDLQAWDVSVVPPGARRYLAARYVQMEKGLVSALVPSVLHLAQPPPPGTLAGALPEAARAPDAAAPGLAAPARADAAATAPVAEDTAGAAPAPAAARTAESHDAAPPAPRRDPEAPARTREDALVEEASRWSKAWKPFLTDSVGWFIGAFLILAGTFYFVSDVWTDLDATGRALLVFCGAAAWTAGFFAWARFLDRREATRRAARVLRLIAGAIAPLPTVALWPLWSASPALFVPLLAGWAGAAAFLGHRVARERDAAAAGPLAGGLALTSVVMALAPLAAPLGHAGLWLNLAPLVVLALLARQGPRPAGERAFAELAALYLLGLFGARLQVALAAAHALPPWPTLAAFGAAAAVLLLELREGPARRAAHPWAVGTIAALAGLSVLAAFGEAPAFFVTCALGAAASARLAGRGPVQASARWHVGTWTFAYFAWQSCGQLVPGVLAELLAALKEALGYPPAAPLPPSYNAVYAAAFVVAVGGLALAWTRSPRARRQAAAPVLLRAAVVTAALVAAMALPVVAQDARPALWSLPAVAVLALAAAARQGWRWAAWVGAGLWALGAVALAFTPQVSAALALALGAALAAAAAVPSLAPSRVPLAAVAFALALGATVVAFAGPPGAAAVAAVVLAGAAALVAARAADLPLGLEAGAALLALAAPVAALWLAPAWALTATALAGAAVGAASLRGGQLARLAPVAIGAALLAPAAELAARAQGAGAPMLGATLLAAAAALGLAGARRWPGAVALALGTLALVPSAPVGAFWAPLGVGLVGPAVAAVAALVLAAWAAAWSWERGRSAHAAALAGAAALVSLAAAQAPVLGWLAVLALVLAGRPLRFVLTVPVAGVLAVALALDGPSWAAVLAALAAGGLALLQRSERARRHLLGDAHVAWPAAAASCALLGAGFLAHGAGTPLTLLVAASALPLAWVAATRSPWPALLLVPGVALAAVLFTERPLAGLEGNLLAALAAPALALAVARLAAAWAPARAALGLRGDFARAALPWTLAVPLAVQAAAGAVLDLPLGPAPAALAVLLGAAAPFPARLALAAACTLFAPHLALPAAAVAAAVGLAGLHAPRRVGAVLATGVDARFAPAAGVATLALLAIAAPWSPAASPWTDAAIPVGVALAALLLRRGALFGVAAVLAAVPLRALAGLALEPGAQAWALLACAVLAAAVLALRVHAVADAVARALATLAPRFVGEVRRPLHLGAAAALALVAVLGGAEAGGLPALALVPAALLLCATEELESGVAAAVGAVVLAVLVPAPLRGAALAGLGAGLAAVSAWALPGAAAARVWRHAGWVLAAGGAALSLDLHAASTPLAWVLGAFTVAAATSGRPAWRPAAWVAALLALHVALFWAGLALATGAPKELILPWVGLASLGLGAARLWVHGPGTRGRLAQALVLLGVLELALGVALNHGPHLREALVATVGVAAAVAALGRHAARRDASLPVLLAVAALAAGFGAWAHLATGGAPAWVDAAGLLGLGAVAGGASAAAARAERPAVAGALAAVAFTAPALAWVVVLGQPVWVQALVLLGASAQWAWRAQSGTWTKASSVAAAAALNLALLFGWQAAGLAHPHYLLVPVGLCLLALSAVFEDDLGADWKARLRAGAVALVYGAAAFRPLAFESTWALWVCVVVCVLGVAAGVALRVRSYVYLGTAFLLTSVVANLVRFGVREPRVGALLLSGLGVAVVAFMVMLTARRGELLARYRQVATLLEAWDA